MKRVLSLLFRELVLRWNLERSHALIATAYGIYLPVCQTFSGPGIGFRAMNSVALAVAPGMDAESLWGSLMVLAGVGTLVGIVSGEARLRQGAAVMLALLWALMAACFYVSNPRSPACIVYAVLAWAAMTRACQAVSRNPEVIVR